MLGPDGFINERAGMIIAPGDAEEQADVLTSMIERLHSYDRAAIAREASEGFIFSCQQCYRGTNHRKTACNGYPHYQTGRFG
jgi:hypothetical protein